MIERLRFYARHSANDLRVNGQRTFFALLCIAAGVAAIVSLGTLANMIQSTLTGNLQVSNRADIAVKLGQGGFMDEELDPVRQAALDNGEVIQEVQQFFGTQNITYYLSPAGVDAIRAWAEETYPGARVTYRAQLADPAMLFFGLGNGGSISIPATGASVSQTSPIVVEGTRYPLYGTITMQDGTPLADALNSADDIVLSDRVARDLGANVGDIVRVSGADSDFTVTGIVDTSQEVTNPTQAFAALFGFYFLDVSALSAFDGAIPRAETVYIGLPQAQTMPEGVESASRTLQSRFPYTNVTTTEDLRVTYEAIASGIDQLTAVMGLVSILIGSIGIVNTMQVIVRRRTLEVAVLKTIGLQGNQVTVLFLVEALIMGVIGSIAGILLGWALVFVIRGTAEQLVGQSLAFAIDIPSAINGFIIGVVVTAVFGFLPTLTAGQVRPGLVLRPTENIIPRTGCLPVLGALALIIVVMSLIASTILGDLSTAFRVIIGAFIAAGFLYGLLSVLIWLFGRFFPSFGVVDLKISLRQMLAGRSRAAVTLLALVIGVFSLSLITLLADSINGLMRFALNEASGSNVLISVISPNQIDDVEDVLSNVEGVNSYRVTLNYSFPVVGIREGDTVLSVDDLRTRAAQNPMQGFGIGDNGDLEDFDITEIVLRQLGSFGTVNVNKLPERSFRDGRQVTSADVGQPVLVVQESELLDRLGIGVGDKVIYRIGNDADDPTIEYEIIGVTTQSLLGGGFDASNYMPFESLPENTDPNTVFILADINDDAIPALRRALADVRGSFVLETAALTQLIESLLGAFTAFPTMVALLGLVVGGVVIANSVALTTMERRKEIAIMKSVGLQRERVLFMILLENGILGLIGGLIGVGIGLVGLVIAVSSFAGPSQAIPFGTALVLMLLCIGVALLAAVTTAWGASGEKPLNVLRYE